jgi:hypothetical protein
MKSNKISINSSNCSYISHVPDTTHTHTHTHTELPPDRLGPWSSYQHLLSSWDYRQALLCLASQYFKGWRRIIHTSGVIRILSYNSWMNLVLVASLNTSIECCEAEGMMDYLWAKLRQHVRLCSHALSGYIHHSVLSLLRCSFERVDDSVS